MKLTTKATKSQMFRSSKSVYQESRCRQTAVAATRLSLDNAANAHKHPFVYFAISAVWLYPAMILSEDLLCTTATATIKSDPANTKKLQVSRLTLGESLVVFAKTIKSPI